MRYFLFYIVVSICIVACSAKALFGDIGFIGGAGGAGLISSEGEYRPLLGYQVDLIQKDTNPPIAAFQIGMFKNFPISKRFEFQPEIHYTWQGLVFRVPGLFERVRVRLNYLKIPLLLKFHLISKKTKLGLYTGPYGAVKLRAKKISVTWDRTENESLTNAKTLDFGVTAGIYTEVPFKTGAIIIDLRVSFGFLNTLGRPENFVPVSDNDGTLKNVTGVILLGFKL